MMYRDLSAKKAFAASQFERERKYWLNKLSGEPVKSSFPPDFKTAGETGENVETVTFEFPAVLFERLMEIINNSDPRLHIVLTTGLTLLLYKYTGNTDIIIGTPIDKQEVEGEFINTVLALRNQIEEQMTVRDFLMQVRQTIIEAGENQNYPLEKIPYELNMRVDEKEFPLFAVAVLLRNIQDQSYIQHIKLNMIFSFLRTAGHLEGVVRYNASLYNKKTIERVINHYIYLLQEAFNHLDCKLIDVPLLTEEDIKHLLVDFNNTGTDYPRDKMIHQLFEEQVERTPEHIAVESNGIKVTYKELNTKANQLGRLLNEKGIEPGKIAAIMLAGSIQVPIAIMAVLKTGGAYLPMGGEYPEERVDYLLKDSGAAILLTGKSLMDKMKIEFPQSLESIIDLEDETLYKGKKQNLEPGTDTNPLAYVIYTSGTTGEPKGVMVEHRGLVNYIWWAAKTYMKNQPAAFSLCTTISFDLTVTSIFTPLVTGNTIVVYKGDDKEFPIEKIIRDNRVGTVKLTPSHLKLIKNLNLEVTHCNIKCLILGGEELETRLTKDIYRKFAGDVEIYNEYGPTETVVGCMIYKFDPGKDTRTSVPIGVPIDNARICLLNEHKQPVPIGVTGQIYVSGDGLAGGFLNKPELTAEKFLPGLYRSYKSHSSYITGRMYKTGDLGKWLPGGNIEYSGRIDRQVKIRGFRIEPAEIQYHLSGYPPVKESVVIDWQDPSGDNELVAYIVPDPKYAPCVRRFMDLEKKSLPDDYQRYELPNGMTVFSLNQGEMEYMYNGIFEERLYLKHGITLDDGACIFDIGANIGMFSLFAHHMCKGAVIYAFEPIPRISKVLNLNMSLFGINGAVFEYGISHNQDEAIFSFYPNLSVFSGRFSNRDEEIETVKAFIHNHLLSEGKEDELAEVQMKTFLEERMSKLSITCPMKTISQVIRESNINKIDLLKISAEKSEKDILRGIDKEDWGKIRQLVIEVHNIDGRLEEIKNLVKMYGYQVRVAQEKVLRNTDLYMTYAVLPGEKRNKAVNKNGYPGWWQNTGWNSPEQLEKNARRYLEKRVPDYMIPPYFVLLEEIPLTANGKLNRDRLPPPRLKIKKQYTAPGSAIERKLADIWSDVLGIEKELIGIDDNFFEHGGHSLKATLMVARIHKELNLRLSLVKMFELPTIKGLSGYLQELKEEMYVSIKPAEEKNYYPMSSAQKRMYLLQQVYPDSINYNIPRVFVLLEELDRAKLENTFMKLIKRHESLRTSFRVIDGDPVQIIRENPRLDIEFYPIHEEEEARGIIKNFIRAFDLGQSPLLRVGLIDVETNSKHLLMVDMHHIISDGVSDTILIRDFTQLYSGSTLPLLKLQYRDYSEWQNKMMESGRIKIQETYWLDRFKGEIPVLKMPTDYPRQDNLRAEGDFIGFVIDEELTKKINRTVSETGTTLFILLLAVFNIMLSKYTNQEDIVVGTDIAGRTHADLQKVIGMFVNMLAMRNYPTPNQSFRTFLGEVKTGTLEAFENQDYQFEELVNKLELARNPGRNPLFDVVFGVDNRDRGKAGKEDLKVARYKFELRISPFDLILRAVPGKKTIIMVLNYSTALYERTTAEKLANHYVEILEQVMENNKTQLKDIKLSHDFIPGEFDIFDEEGDFEFSGEG